MPETMERLETDEIVERGQAIFDAHIKPLIGDKNPDDFLAIDINSGDFEVAPDDLTPGDKLRARHPDARVFLRRVGDDAAYSVGRGYHP